MSVTCHVKWNNISSWYLRHTPFKNQRYVSMYRVCVPVWQPILRLKVMPGRWGISRSFTVRTKSSAMMAISAAWRFPFCRGTPKTETKPSYSGSLLTDPALRSLSLRPRVQFQKALFKNSIEIALEQVFTRFYWLLGYTLYMKCLTGRGFTWDHHVGVTDRLHLVHIVHLNPLIKAGVQTVQHVDHLI